jgi:hypothetical protein
VSCPLPSLRFAAKAADQPATDNKGSWPEGDIAAMAAKVGIGTPAFAPRANSVSRHRFRRHGGAQDRRSLPHR